MNYTITPLSFNHQFTSFQELSRLIHRTESLLDMETLNWYFQENPYNPGGQHLFHVCLDRDKVIATDGLVPVPLVIEGKRFLAAWSVKTMTHPDYRGQGLFRALTEYNLKVARERGIQLILGIANGCSFPGYVKFGWEVLFERKAAIRLVDISESLTKRGVPQHLARLANLAYRNLSGPSGRDGFTYREVNEIPANTSKNIWQDVKDVYPVQLERNFNYLNWRYNQRPGNEYRTIIASQGKQDLGMLVYRRASTTQSLMALDYIGPPAQDVLTGLYNRLTKTCREQGFRYVLDSSQISLQKLLIIHCGYRSRGRPLENNMFIACPLRGSAPKTLWDHQAWAYGYGDSELDIDLPF